MTSPIDAWADRNARGAEPRALSTLLARFPADVREAVPDLAITGVTADSREVHEGSLFVALRGEKVDGHQFVGAVAEQGASAVVVEQPPETSLAIPVIQVDNTRIALAHLAAAWHGHPADVLTLFGITGTVGKTSVLTILEAILLEAGRRLGTVGSLGLRIDGETQEETGFTAPDPLFLQWDLRRIVDAGIGFAAMEVTSHALSQHRVAGLRYQAGILTNLIPLEHRDYHGSFAGYLEAKQRYFDHVESGAPIVYGADNLAADRIVRDHDVRPVSCGTDPDAMARIEVERIRPSGTRLTLNIQRSLPRLEGGDVEPLRLPLEMRLLGRGNVANAAMAATAALVLGVGPEPISRAVRAIRPVRRRMEILQEEPFLVMDDAVAHPESIGLLFEVVESLEPRRLHIAYAVRGNRGADINFHSAETLGIWCGRVAPATLALTRSVEVVDELNHVADEEHEAFCRALRKHGVAWRDHQRLDTAVEEVLDAAEPGDLVLLLGGQGMHPGKEIAERWMRRR